MKKVFSTIALMFRRFAPESQNPRLFLLNLGVGLAIVIAQQFGNVWLNRFEDGVMDAMMRLSAIAGVENLMADGSDANHFVFVDVDEATYRKWNMEDSYHIPRDKLRSLILFAVDSGAKAILVDIDFSRKGTDPVADEALRSFMANYQDGWPDLFLMQTFDSCCLDYPTPAIRKAYFHDSVRPGAPIHWVQPLFLVDAYDRRVRRWNLLKVGCLREDSGDNPVWIPSAQLAVDILLRKPPDESWNDVWKSNENQAGLARRLPAQCGGAASFDDDATLDYGAQSIELNPDKLKQRILYTVFDKVLLGDEQKGFSRVPAWQIAGSGPGSPPAGKTRDGPIIIIGSSYLDSHDIQPTPLGDMPGALIILNAVKSLHDYGQLHENEVYKQALQLVFIVLAALVFKFYRPLQGGVIIIAVLLVVVVPLSFLAFHSGVWLDFVAPFGGMQLHRFVEELKESMAKPGESKLG